MSLSEYQELTAEPTTKRLTAIASIVFIHGLQGHPYRTWASTKSMHKGIPSDELEAGSPAGSSQKRVASSSIDIFRRAWPKRAKAVPGSSVTDDSNGTGPSINPDRFDSSSTLESASNPSPRSHPSDPGAVYWPGDLLPQKCPNARILAWGYDTVVTKRLSAPSNQNDILSHAKDLLYSLGRERPMDRPIIFVVHSLGGIVAKEMLANSADSEELSLRNIVQSTAAIVFLGTPHRGSKEMANLGDLVRKVTSSLLMDTTPAALDALGLKTSDLARCRDSFSKLWREYDFTVKTFKESLGLTGFNIGGLSDKVVPDDSAELGDPRERTETLQANHRNMCRFTGVQDPNYRKVAGELQQIYTSIERASRGHQTRHMPGIPILHTKAEFYGQDYGDKGQINASLTEGTSADSVSLDAVNILRFPKMNRRLRSINEPAPMTCRWLLLHPTYITWRRRENVDHHRGLLWIRGKPGSGKSTLLRETFRDVLKTTGRDICCVFFFNTKGGRLERSAEGLCRSLLYQLLSRFPAKRSLLAASWGEYQQQRRGGLSKEPDDSEFPWDGAEVRTFLTETISSLSGERVVILIDALDECDSGSSREVAYFLRDLTDSAYQSGTYLDVCFSGRHFPFVTLRDCLEICVEDSNAADIALYVDKKLSSGGFRQQMDRDSVQVDILRDSILAKASGVFLWVVLVVDRLLKEHDEGANVKHLIARLNEIPAALSALFADLLSKNCEDAETTVRFFQWAILGPSSLRLRQWRHVLGFVRCGSFTSLKQWQASQWYPENDQQLERQIRSISMGLVEVISGRRATAALYTGAQVVEDVDSTGAGAGSLAEEGETRTVQVVHQSVREFFLGENGFLTLDPSLKSNAVGLGHVTIVHNCFDYMCLNELDSLVAARKKAAQLRRAAELNQEPVQKPARPSRRARTPSSVASFESAGSAGYSPPPEPVYQAPKDPIEDVAILEKLNGVYQDSDDLLNYRVSLLLQGDEETVPRNFVSSEPSASSRAASSVEVVSTVLEADLPLLDYSTTMPTAHARYAEAAGANQEGLILRLRDGKVWGRWQLLKEDIPLGYTLQEYLTEQKLTSWVDRLLPSTLGDDPYETFLSAVREGKQATVAELVRKDVEEPFYPLQEPLLHRLLQGGQQLGALQYLRKLDKLVKAEHFTPSSLPVNVLSPLGHTPLNLATSAADLPTVSLLLELGADVNASDNFGRRPIDRACSSNMPHAGLVRLLIKNQADLGPPGPDLPSPLQLIIMNCSKYTVSAIAGQLLCAGAGVNPEGTGGHTPLTMSCDKDNCDEELINKLISFGAQVNAQDGLGQTALHVACNRNNININLITILLKHGCAPGIRDRRGWSALHIACSRDRPVVAVVSRLLEADRQIICAADDQGVTPLHIAVRCSNSFLVRTLIENGARVDAADELGNTPVSAALARLQQRKDLGDVIIAKSVITVAEQLEHTSSDLTALKRHLEVLGR